MKTIYFDNAASTPLLDEVIDEMTFTTKELFGNPSSTHFAGRKSKNKIEECRRNIAQHFGALTSEITFTSGATEANNIILSQVVNNLNINTIISSKIEHKAVLEPIKKIAQNDRIKLVYVDLDDDGQVDYSHLKSILEEESLRGKVLVSLMAANNEIGNLLSFESIVNLKQHYNFYFHSDTVQLIGHEKFKFSDYGIDFATCSAHKFHGPKNVGFIYCNKKISLLPLYFGGGQERGIKPGTENIAGIAGMDKALTISLEGLDNDKRYIKNLKSYFIEQIQNTFNDKICINGDQQNNLYTILNIGFNKAFFPPMLMFNLDMKNIAISGGSACSSGSSQGSHVIDNIKSNPDFIPVRFSFSKFNTKQEIDLCIKEIESLMK